MSPLKDYYEILGVSPEADAAAIELAYKQESFRWHPDRNADRPEEAHRRFLDLSEAAAILGDPVSRRHYDRRRKPAHGKKPRRSAAPATGAGAEAGAGTSAAPAAPAAPASPAGRKGRLSVEELVRQAGVEQAASGGAGGGAARFDAQVEAVLAELGLRRSGGGPGILARLVMTLATMLAFGLSVLLGLSLLGATAWPEPLVWSIAAIPGAAMFALLIRTWVHAWKARTACRHDRKVAESIVRRYRDR